MTADARQQEANGKVVARFVYGCMSMEIETMFKYGWEHPDDFPTIDDIENYYVPKDWDQLVDSNKDKWDEFLSDEYPDLIFEAFGSLYDTFKSRMPKSLHDDVEEFKDWCVEFSNIHPEREFDPYDAIPRIEADDDLQAEFLEHLKEEGGDWESEYYEIFEWWLVDSWFGEKLAEMGEAILSLSLMTAWGRRTTGQAILLDGIITEFQKKHAKWAMPEEETAGEG